MESKLLLMTVEDVFQLEGRGTLVTGWFVPGSVLAERGVAIELEPPAQTGFLNSIAEVEIFRKGRLEETGPKAFGLLLATPIPSEQIPLGTKVYYAGAEL